MVVLGFLSPLFEGLLLGAIVAHELSDEGDLLVRRVVFFGFGVPKLPLQKLLETGGEHPTPPSSNDKGNQITKHLASFNQCFLTSYRK